MLSLFTRKNEAPETSEFTGLQARSRWRRGLQRWWLWLSEHFTPEGPRFRTHKLAVRAAFLGLLSLSAVFGMMLGLLVVYSVDLPQMEDLARYRPSTTTELLDVHGKTIGSFALERRVVVPYEEFPAVLREALISIEDKSFERNWGVNLVRAVGAAYRDLHSNERAQGASTLTMQLAKNLFLSNEKTFGRKFQEIFLSMQIERRYTKEQIFALYANQIYLGHGTYGFEAGSEFYFSKHVRDLTLPEAALLAALPKGAEGYSPLKHPERALKRRNLVLTEMRLDGKITVEQEDEAKAAPLGLHIESPPNSVAPYFVEEVRRQLEKQYGAEEVHGAGLRVFTTLDLDLQVVANKAVLDGVASYERRHGWKGHLQNVAVSGSDLATYRHPDWTQSVSKGSYIHGLVTGVSATKAVVRIGAQQVTMGPADWIWTQQTRADRFLRPGDVVYVRIESGGTPPPASGAKTDPLAPSGNDDKTAEGLKGAQSAGSDRKKADGNKAEDGVLQASLQQDSGAQAAMMAVDNSNGEVVAMVGGRDFALSQFNRATQAQRQVGSSFKPYVYTAAVENGSKPTDTIVDGPVSFPTPQGWYTPHNYEPDWKGTMSLLSAFAESRNIPALKLANQLGIRKVIEVAKRFGITSNLPAFLPIAIGAADITLYEQVGAYTVFPNDGIRIEPHYIRKISQADGMPLEEKRPQVNEVISVDTARTMMQFLEAVVKVGTGAAARQLNHPFGGKTGTTNDYTDAWFIGFSPSVTCGTWMGFDNRETLGSKETGAKAALPIWMDFMKAAIAGKPNETFATAGAPKKVLDVTATAGDDSSAEGAKAKAPEGADSEGQDTDSASPKSASPAGQPTVPTEPRPPTGPAEPAEGPRTGAPPPRPDIE